MTIEPFELYKEEHWELYDPNEAKVIATFHDEDHANAYLNIVNAQQEMRRKKRAAITKRREDCW